MPYTQLLSHRSILPNLSHNRLDHQLFNSYSTGDGSAKNSPLWHLHLQIAGGAKKKKKKKTRGP